LVVERDTSLLEVQRRSVCIAQISHATVKVTERCRCIYGGVQCGHAARVPRDKKTVGALTTGMHERVRHRSLHMNLRLCTAGRRLSTHSTDFEQRDTRARGRGRRQTDSRETERCGGPAIRWIEWTYTSSEWASRVHGRCSAEGASHRRRWCWMHRSALSPLRGVH
jgi:hypothetical protein